MNILLTVLILIASVLLIAIVYIQNPKGGGLSSDFGAAHQMGGVQQTNDFIDKATWSLAGIIAVLSIVMTLRTKSFDATPKAEQPAQTEQQQGAPQGQQDAAPQQ
ncbi:MAG: preprotein translocase subunit SecG [Crocinitomicaceae bacterium]|nr:preprotein translocase subunit SecG [Crocinitomicaceae bacterium]